MPKGLELSQEPAGMVPYDAAARFVLLTAVAAEAQLIKAVGVS